MSDSPDDHEDWPSASDDAHDWTVAEDLPEWEGNGEGGGRLSASEAAWARDEDRDLGTLDQPTSDELESDLSRSRSTRRFLAVVVVAAMVLASAGIAGALLFLGEDGVDELPEAAPIPTGPAPGEPGFDEVVAQLQAFVSEARGLEFLMPVDLRLVDGEEFEAELLEEFEEDAEELRLTGRLLAAVGLIDPGHDFVELFRQTLTAGVVGFYDPEDDQLVVKGTQLTPHARVTLVHELDHALQDQHFELHRPELEDADDESALGFSALAEGDATRIDQAYRATLTPEEQEQAAAEEIGAADLSTLLSVPPVLIQLVVFPYSAGPGFVEAVLEAGGQEVLDAAFAEPPTTSEHIIHPPRYLRGEERLEVEPPQSEGDVIDQGVWGSLALALMIGDGAATPEALAAVDGWGGDWYVAWERGEQLCVRSRVVVDRPDTLAALVTGLEQWQEREGGNVEEEDSGESVLFTSCV